MNCEKTGEKMMRRRHLEINKTTQEIMCERKEKEPKCHKNSQNGHKNTIGKFLQINANKEQTNWVKTPNPDQQLAFTFTGVTRRKKNSEKRSETDKTIAK